MDAPDAAWLTSGPQATKTIFIVSAAVLVFDHLCSLDKEFEGHETNVCKVNLVWKRQLGSSATVLFLANRYIPYIYVFSCLEEYWVIRHSHDACRHRDIANNVIIAIGITVSELILCLRTWAIWGCSRRIWGLLAGTFMCFKIPLVSVAFYYMMKNVNYIYISPTEIVCISPVIGRWSWETLLYVVVLCFESLIAILTIIRTVKVRHSSSEWVLKIHHTGIIYYVCSFMMSIVNLIGTICFHNMGMESFAIMQGVLQSVLCNRVIFLVREPAGLGVGTTQTYLMDHWDVDYSLRVLDTRNEYAR
ncbi:hypothetical protein P691DRAFT_759011 [Macrolepiota fuliginosa MF-IS2]|uniref:DUF6533 domain-containing protein n=1 Tax=Macrolepiota fuliginosa MF-IS2 TaxID=1400762 RepID=A0A9P5XED9_9AGAR|nr:hypothetical protein P691DRAFT_759011 [Macrolepiota fuliginosa MF-IS2]